MGKFYEEIPSFVVPWIKEQKLFWVATAPLTGDGHVNVSPKGIFSGNFTVVNSHQVWYEDLTGSGIETVSHLRENGRITVMFIAFDGPPRICRMFGKGTVYEFGTPQYDTFISPEKRQPGSRSVIFVDVYKVSTSCGFSVPFYSFKGYRMKLHETAVRFEDKDIAAEEALVNSPNPAATQTLPLTEKGIKHYWKSHNAQSLDGLPGLQSAAFSQDRFKVVDPKTLKYTIFHANESTRWISSQWVLAFTLGTVAGASVLRLLQHQHIL